MNWKVKYGIILLIASILMYSFAFLFLNEPDKVFFYIVIDCAFIPLDVLVVVLVIEGVIENKEKEAILDKLDMILGAFFSELGNELLTHISKVNTYNGEIINQLKNIDTWNEKDFKNAYKYLKTNGVSFKVEIPKSETKEFIMDLKELITEKRRFLIELLENPNIIEKDSFANLLLAIFHLDDELELRTDLDRITAEDFKHLLMDINRVYCSLTYQWVKYLEYLNKHYPYMSSLAIRTNPFNPESKVYIDW